MGVNSGSGAYPTLGGLGGVLISNPTKPSHSHSAQASPTNTLRLLRPRARSADESNKKVLLNFNRFFIKIFFVNSSLMKLNECTICYFPSRLKMEIQISVIVSIGKIFTN